MKYIFILSAIFFVNGFNGCLDSSSSDEKPEWVKTLIEKFQNEPVGNPPQSVWRYTFHLQTVYYIPPQCCDQFSILYDSDGTIICAPDGGLTGMGDGKCPEFFKDRKNEKLIWLDTRKK
jgi:hypothetical protein